MPGSGGAHDITVLANKVIAVMPSDPRRFVNNVDFITSPNSPYGNREGVVGVAMPDAYFSFDTGRPILQKIYSDRNADAINGIRSNQYCRRFLQFSISYDLLW